MQHCMLDLETMGTSPGCRVLSIGAVIFDPETGTLGDTLKVNLQEYPQEIMGLHREPKTEKWWEGQSDAAKAGLLNPAPVHPHDALYAFNAFLRNNHVGRVWGHGAGFDQPILEKVYRAFNIVPAWDFWNNRDTRTLFELAGVSPNRSKGVHHDSLADATAQAIAACEAYAVLGMTNHGAWERIRMAMRYRRTGSHYEFAA
jgi:3' exoribonuclease, RNase T-like